VKIIELAEILHAIQKMPSNQIDFVQGLRIEKVIHAFARSSGARAWMDVE